MTDKPFTYKSLEELDSENKGWVAALLEVPEEQHSQGRRVVARMYRSFFRVYEIREKIFTIMEQLENADIVNDLLAQKQYQTQTLLNYSFYLGGFLGVLKSKGLSKRMMVCGSLIVVKNLFLDPLGYRAFMLNCALHDQESQLAQETRNLYTFYFPHNEESLRMQSMIQAYNQQLAFKREVTLLRQNMFD